MGALLLFLFSSSPNVSAAHGFSIASFSLDCFQGTVCEMSRYIECMTSDSYIAEFHGREMTVKLNPRHIKMLIARSRK